MISSSEKFRNEEVGNFVMNITGPINFYRYWFKNCEIKLSDPCLAIPYTNHHKISSLCEENKSLPITYTLWNEGTN